MHSVKVTLISDQMIKFDGEEINVHDVLSIIAQNLPDGTLQVLEMCVRHAEDSRNTGG